MKISKPDTWDRHPGEGNGYWVQKYHHMPINDAVYLTRIYSGSDEWKSCKCCKSCKYRQTYFYTNKSKGYPRSLMCNKHNFDLMDVTRRCVALAECEHYLCDSWERKEFFDDLYNEKQLQPIMCGT